MYFVVSFILSVLIILYVFVKLTCGHCYCNKCLVGKTALITGGNSGIGHEIALKLASRGCTVIIAGRNQLEEAKSRIIRTTGNPNISAKYLDLSSLKSVRDFAKDINENVGKLDIFINNAGISNSLEPMTEDGLNTIMQINHFGPFLLTYLLLDLLKKSAPSRIIFTTSILAFLSKINVDTLNNSFNAEKPFTVLRSYSDSKLCSMIATNGFAKLLQNSQVTCNCVHPGVVDTKIFDSCFLKIHVSIVVKILFNLWKLLLFKNIQDGAQTTFHLAVCSKLENVTGEFFLDCRKALFKPSLLKNERICTEIWSASEDYVKLESNKIE